MKLSNTIAIVLLAVHPFVGARLLTGQKPLLMPRRLSLAADRMDRAVLTEERQPLPPMPSMDTHERPYEDRDPSDQGVVGGPIAQQPTGLFGVTPENNEEQLGLAPEAPEFFSQNRNAAPEDDPEGNCHPACRWSCGGNSCDQTCEPVCAPPQCETACSPITLASCHQVCDPPICAVVCPVSHCEHRHCPRCKTICAPAKCRTECNEHCESKCQDPQCTWKCEAVECPHPACSLQCDGPKQCDADASIAEPAHFAQGMDVLSKGLAGMDPAAVVAAAGPAAAPAAAL